jgi:hypothetical protein
VIAVPICNGKREYETVSDQAEGAVAPIKKNKPKHKGQKTDRIFRLVPLIRLLAAPREYRRR